MGMDRCPVCGGAFKCPGGLYDYVRDPMEGEIRYAGPDDDLGPDWVLASSWKIGRGGSIWVRRRGDDGAEPIIMGSADSGRVHAHYGVHGTRVGHCRYAFYVVPAGRDA
jgi:hypothetical protein